MNDTMNTMNDTKKRIAISGSYGGMNSGDEAILAGILGELRRTVAAEVTVFTRNAADTLRRHDVERAVEIRGLTRREARREIEGLDLLVLGGGGILYDRDVEVYLREVQLAQELGVPVMVYAISAGPLTHPGTRRAVQQALEAVDVITVRDRQGYRLLEDVGVTNDIHLTADPALLVEPEPLPIEALHAEGVDFDRNVVGFSVREPGPAAPDIDPEEYHVLLAHAADFVIERYDADVVFVPMEKADVRHSHGVVAHMRNAERAEILRRRYTSGQLIDLMGRFELAVGMRLHFLVFAALKETPFLALPYAPKVTGLLDHLGMETPPLGDIGIGQLIGRIDRAWDRRADIRKRIGERLPILRAEARRTNALMCELLARKAPARHVRSGGEAAAGVV